ncbi:DUF1839 family protein, partial [Tardiphaga sp. P5_C10]
LQEHGDPALERARLAAEAIAGGTKIVQFQFARASARGKVPDVADAIRQLATDYDIALDSLMSVSRLAMPRHDFSVT